MVRSRRGAGRIGCLLVLLIITAIGYFGANVGEAYWNFYRYQDRMKSEAQFAGAQHGRGDQGAHRRVRGLARPARIPRTNVIVRRGEHEIFIYANYNVRVEFPAR